MNSTEAADAPEPEPGRSAGAGRLFVFAGGGTGGHLAPGIAVADELRRRNATCRIRFIGSGRPVEQRMLTAAGYDLTAHSAPPLSSVQRHPLRFLTAHARAVTSTRREFRRDPPAAVVGLGGFASVPVVLAARYERVPVLLLEQNVIPGRATWWLSRRHPVCVTFPETQACLPKHAKCHVTGNPLRRDIEMLARRIRQPDGTDASSTETLRVESAHSGTGPVDEPPERTLLVLGGSHGSQQINQSAVHAVQALRRELAGWLIIHQSGPDAVEDIRAAYADCGLKAVVEPFFDSLSGFYARTTLAISRAGATTLTEFAAAGIPSILIPYPLAAADHQTRNAQVFAAVGASIRVENVQRSSEALDLTDMVRDLLAAPARLADMRAAALSLFRPDAAGQVADRLLLAAG